MAVVHSMASDTLTACHHCRERWVCVQHHDRTDSVLSVLVAGACFNGHCRVKTASGFSDRQLCALQCDDLGCRERHCDSGVCSVAVYRHDSRAPTGPSLKCGQCLALSRCLCNSRMCARLLALPAVASSATCYYLVGRKTLRCATRR
jgi:hypothetical protein